MNSSNKKKSTPHFDKEQESKVLEENINLVYKVVHRFKPHPSKFDDFVQEGCIGLLNAIRTYNPNKGKFSTLAYTCIRNRIIKYIFVREDRYDRIKKAVYEENLNNQRS